MTNESRKVLIIIGTTLAVYLSFRYILPLVLPFFVAYLLAKSLLPMVNFLHKKLKFPRTFSAVIMVLTLTSIIGGLVFFVCKTAMSQIQKLVINLPVYQKIIDDKLLSICSHCDKWFGLKDGSLTQFLGNYVDQFLMNIKTKIVPSMTQYTLDGVLKIFAVFGVFFIILISVLMIIKDMDELKKNYEDSWIYEQIHPVTGRLSGAGFAYLRAQMIIISIITAVCSFGLFLIHNDYALLIGIGIAVFDAFPVLGSGSILVPWAVWKLFTGNVTEAAILLTLYLCCQLIRQTLEPKLIGDRIGVKPIFTIMAMYAGAKLFGIEGFILGPIALIVVNTIVQSQQ